MQLRLSLLGLATVILAIAQTPAETPGFEVVSVKSHELPPNQIVFRFRGASGVPEPKAQGNHYEANIATIQDLLTEAYGVYSFQIFGLPDWALAPAGEHFDIDARVEGDASPSTAQLRLLLQRLLADRFQLKLHRETRPVLVYALMVRNPAKIKEISKEQYDNQPRYSRTPERFPETSMTTMGSLARIVQTRVDRPVLDETKLTGYYEIATPEWMQPNRARSADPVEEQSQVFSELESRDGLKLESRKDPFEVLVIDHVERPSPN